MVLAGLDGNLTPVGWDSSDAPYLTSAHWSRGGPALICEMEKAAPMQAILRLHEPADPGSEPARRRGPEQILRDQRA